MRWQTHARAALGVLLLALAGGVMWYVMRQGPSAESQAPSPRTDDEAETEIGADEIVRTDNGAVVYRIKFERGFIYPAATSRMRLVGVSGILPRGGEPMEFRADEADIKLKAGAMGDPAKFDEMHMRGNVLLESGTEPLHFETSDAVYNEITGIVTTEQAAKIRRGNMSGSGTGATFDRNRSVVWLLNDAKVSIATEGQGTVDVTATRAGLAQAEHYMRFEENVRLAREGRLIETDAAVANLTPDGNRITSLELRGNSRVTGGAGGDGGVPNMRGDDITITYNDATGALQRTVLMRAARIELPEGGGRSLAADYIDMGFAADGTTVTMLDATDAVELKIPADGDQPAREVRAPRLEARGAEPKGLERAQFSGGVEFRERAPAKTATQAINRVGCSETASPDRVGCSDTLVLGLDGGFDKITTADFSGNVRFRDADVTAKAPEAKYNVDRKYIALRGDRGVALVEQDDGTVQAKEIDLTLDPRKMAARGEVKSTLKPGARKDRKEPRPSILEDDAPVNITARTLDYDGVADRAVYTGDARLWQGETTIQAETIVLDDKTGNLEARKKVGSAIPVRTLFMIREDPAPGAKPEPVKPKLATAEELIYDESERKATFRQNARLDGPDGNITADRIEIFLKEDGNTLERADAFDNVKASLGNNRGATGDRLIYNAATRIYKMTGKPLVVRQQIEDTGAAGKIRCEKTVGASLTLNRLTDLISVTGANGAPTRAVLEPCGARLPVP